MSGDNIVGKKWNADHAVWTYRLHWRNDIKKEKVSGAQCGVRKKVKKKGRKRVKNGH